MLVWFSNKLFDDINVQSTSTFRGHDVGNTTHTCWRYLCKSYLYDSSTSWQPPIWTHWSPMQWAKNVVYLCRVLRERQAKPTKMLHYVYVEEPQPDWLKRHEPPLLWFIVSVMIRHLVEVCHHSRCVSLWALTALSIHFNNLNQLSKYTRRCSYGRLHQCIYANNKCQQPSISLQVIDGRVGWSPQPAAEKWRQLAQVLLPLLCCQLSVTDDLSRCGRHLLSRFSWGAKTNIFHMAGWTVCTSQRMCQLHLNVIVILGTLNDVRLVYKKEYTVVSGKKNKPNKNTV